MAVLTFVAAHGLAGEEVRLPRDALLAVHVQLLHQGVHLAVLEKTQTTTVA